MKVLHVLGCLNKGGTENFVVNHSNMLKDDIDFVFMTINARPSTYETIFARNHWKVYISPKWNKFNIFKMFFYLKKIKEQEHIDIVHCHLNADNYFILLFAYMLGIKKRISHSHDTFGLESSNILRKVFNYLKVLIIRIFSTDYLACSFEAGNYLYGNTFKKKGIVINNGIDIKKFINVADKDIYEIKKKYQIINKKIIGNISRFEAKKNQMFILEIFKELLNYDHNYILVLGGPDSGLLPKVKLRVKQLKLQDNVIFLNVVENIETWLKIFDLFLFPSKFEGLGIVLLESQASGTCFLSSDKVPKNVDMNLGLANFLSLNCSANEWAKKIIQLINYKQPDDKTITDLFNSSKFTLEMSSKELKKIYYDRKEK